LATLSSPLPWARFLRHFPAKRVSTNFQVGPTSVAWRAARGLATLRRMLTVGDRIEHRQVLGGEQPSLKPLQLRVRDHPALILATPAAFGITCPPAPFPYGAQPCRRSSPPPRSCTSP
jgi:hypothetical protein